jgi:hypothetical protein
MRTVVYNTAEVESRGVAAGGIAVGAVLAEAQAGKKYDDDNDLVAVPVKTTMNGSITNAAGTGNGAASLTMETFVYSSSDAFTLAVAGGILAGAGADSDAESSPTIETSILGAGASTVRVRVHQQESASPSPARTLMRSPCGCGVSVGVSTGYRLVSPVQHLYPQSMYTWWHMSVAVKAHPRCELGFRYG